MHYFIRLFYTDNKKNDSKNELFNAERSNKDSTENFPALIVKNPLKLFKIFY